MVKRIDSLTAEQVAKIPEWAKKWIDIGLSTEPADFDAATEAALKAYTLCNLKKPMVILRMQSPYAATVGGALAWSMLRKFSGAQVRDQVGAQVGAQVWDQVGAQVGAQVWDQVRDQVWDQVRAQVRAQVGAQVRDQVRAQVWAENFQAAKEGLSNEGIANLWCAFTAFATFFRDVCGWGDAVILAKLEINETLVKSCGWTWWHQNVLAISDRPKYIKRDDNGRLHCATGASIEYRDGWSLYNWHGVHIPKEWVTGKPPNPSECLTWTNIEQRRAACEIVGWKNILAQLNVKVIDQDGDDEIGTLLEADIPDSGKERFLQVKCGTKRDFVLPVPREIKTAIEAQEWMWQLPKGAYIPEIRT